MLIFLAIIVALFAALAIVNKMQNSEKAEGNPYGKDALHPETVKQLEDKNYQNLILPNDLEKKLDKSEDAIVYFYSPTCEYCKIATPDVNKAAKDMGIDVKQLNVLEFEDQRDKYGIEFTPTLVVFENGKEKDRLEGAHKEGVSGYKDFFEKNIQ